MLRDPKPTVLARRVLGRMQIFGKTLTEETITLDAGRSCTIDDVKAIIERADEGTPDEDLCLAFARAPLQDGCTMAAYNIQDDTTLQQVKRQACAKGMSLAGFLRRNVQARIADPADPGGKGTGKVTGKGTDKDGKRRFDDMMFFDP